MNTAAIRPVVWICMATLWGILAVLDIADHAPRWKIAIPIFALICALATAYCCLRVLQIKRQIDANRVAQGGR